jgi:menaquinone-dependent protoporphyrinogen oxidase
VGRVRVLVTYGSRMGGTAGIAEVIGGELHRQGFEVDIVPAHLVRGADGYDGFVVGGALYAGRWHRDARRFVRDHIRRLREHPTWLFSSGPLDASADEHDLPPTALVHRLGTLIGARGHLTFGGRLPTDATGFPASVMAKDRAGDWRDLDAAREWAVGIARALEGSTPTPV